MHSNISSTKLSSTTIEFKHFSVFHVLQFNIADRRPRSGFHTGISPVPKERLLSLLIIPMLFKETNRLGISTVVQTPCNICFALTCTPAVAWALPQRGQACWQPVFHPQTTRGRGQSAHMKALTPPTNTRKCQTWLSAAISSRCLTQVTHCPNRELVLPLCLQQAPFGSLRGCSMIKHVDIQSHHIIVAIQPLTVVVVERIFSTTVTLTNETHNHLPQSPLLCAQPCICLKDCNILQSAVL